MKNTFFISVFCVIFSGFQLSFAADGSPDPSNSSSWPAIKAALFKDNPEIPYDDVLQLETPIRSADAALTPIEIRTKVSQDSSVYIEKIYLVIDNNPAPIVGEFELYKINANAGIATRVRVNSNSFIRAIAQTSDGKLHMTANYVKASGGCSAPASSNDDELSARRGKMKLRSRRVDDLNEIQLMISHPNYSGLQINQVNQLWIPADYVNEVQLSLDEQPILKFSAGISFSENPSVRFFLDPEKKGTLRARVTDSMERFYVKQWPLS